MSDHPPAIETYSSLVEIAKAHGVSKQAVHGWTKKGSWPIPAGQPLVKSVVDEYVAGTITPHRKKPAGGYRKARHTPATPAPDGLDMEVATLEQLERAIRRARNSDEAERLSKQVRALKVVGEIRDRDGSRIDAQTARAEIGSVLHFFQTALMGLPRTLSTVLEGMESAEIEAVLEGRLTEVLKELKRGMEQAIARDDTNAPHSVHADAATGAEPPIVAGDDPGADPAGEVDA
jgi:hypothetical protein